MGARGSLEHVQDLFEFLQGDRKGCTIEIEDQPQLTPDQAWTAVWWIQNQYHQYSDEIERCSDCEDFYDSAEGGISSPHLGQLCDGCMEGVVRCGICEEYDDQHRMLAVVNGEEAGMDPGLYLITSFPYYWDGIIEGHLRRDCLEKIGPVPDDVDEGWPCSHLCRSCQKKVTRDQYAVLVARCAEVAIRGAVSLRESTGSR